METDFLHYDGPGLEIDFRFFIYFLESAEKHLGEKSKRNDNRMIKNRIKRIIESKVDKK